jgi:DNA-directed RNA polymerase specialized sigma24 family protein
MGKRLSSPDGIVADGFGTTSWSLVLSAVRNEDGGAALDRLCRRYRKVIVVYSQRLGLSPHDAEDATQDFFAYLLDREWLSEAGPTRGSFRGFIFTLLKHFLSNRRRTEESQKRGGPPRPEATYVVEVEALASAEPDPAAAYDRMWAICVVESAANRLAEEQSGASHSARFQALRGFLTRSPTTADYDSLVQVLGEPRNRIAVYLHRLVRRYGELIRAEVADTLANLDDVDIELRRLMEVLSF